MTVVTKLDQPGHCFQIDEGLGRNVTVAATMVKVEVEPQALLQASGKTDQRLVGISVS